MKCGINVGRRRGFQGHRSYPRHDSVCSISGILRTSLGLREAPGELQDRLRNRVGSSDDALNRSQRYKANLEKLASGDLVQVVEVVRDLAGRDASRGLSAGENRMLAKARLILLQEG